MHGLIIIFFHLIVFENPNQIGVFDLLIYLECPLGFCGYTLLEYFQAGDAADAFNRIYQCTDRTELLMKSCLFLKYDFRLFRLVSSLSSSSSSRFKSMQHFLQQIPSAPMIIRVTVPTMAYSA